MTEAEELIQELASKLESQISRNPELPAAYSVLVHRAFKFLRKDIEGPVGKKVSTKSCQKCGNTKLAEIRTHNVKWCTDCSLKIDWYLDPGQKPLLR